MLLFFYLFLFKEDCKEDSLLKIFHFNKGKYFQAGILFVRFL